MTRASLAALVLIVSTGAAACADNILKERPAARAAKATPAKPAFSVVAGESSVCASYRRQLQSVRVAQTISSLADQREAYRAKELTLNAIIADACE
jgi:hypothetical protein